MKKLKILFLSIMFCAALNAQAPLSFNVNAGDAAIGLLGAELEVSRFSLGAGWRQVGIVYPNTRYDSYNIGFTVYSNELGGIKPTEPGVRNYLYISSTYSSIALLVKNQDNPGTFKAVPGLSLLAGIRMFFLPDFSQRLSAKCGIGLNMNEAETQFTFELVFVFSIFNNKNRMKFKCD